MTAADDETRRLDLTDGGAERTRVLGDPAAEPTVVLGAAHPTDLPPPGSPEPTAVLWGPPRAEQRVDGPPPWPGSPDTYRPAGRQPYQTNPWPGAPTSGQPAAAPRYSGQPSAPTSHYYGAGYPYAGSGYGQSPYAQWPGTPAAGAWGAAYAPPGQSYPPSYPGYPAGYSPGPYQPAPPPRRNNRGFSALIAFLLVATLGWASFTWMGNPLAGLSPSQEATTEPSSGPARPNRPQRTPALPGSGADSDTTVRAAMSTGVVLISAETSSGAAAGTGMVITADGRVLTNYHVVAGSEGIEVTLADSGDTYTATVIGFDQSRDVALLQLRDAFGLETVTVDDDGLQVGADVSAVGNANGGGVLVRANGLVTDLSEDLTVSSDSPWGSTEDLEGLIQTTAGAVPGHSGGPMFDEEAEVIGITTAGSTRAGTSYAVPIAEALSIVDQINSGVEVGTVRIGPAGYLGIRVVDEEERGATGVVVDVVTDDSPAAEAGLTEGSTLVRVGDTTITRRTNVAVVIRSLEPGQQVRIAWIDPDGDEREATVTMGSSPVN